ncbi:MAG: tetraacyldisaccharide 4'-kinase [Verrucomicrobiota bacterium]
MSETAEKHSKLKSRLHAVESFLVDVVYDRRSGKSASVVGFVLNGFSYLFELIVRCRLFLYGNRILRNRPLGCLVVVVGNLTVGGTGKTPVVEKFARSLSEQGRKVAILSRGYKSKKEPFYKKWWRWISHASEPPPRVVSDGKEVLIGPREAGDEPYMLARNLPGVHVLVDKNRVKAGAYAIRRFGCDTLILDDGLQYLPLKGSMNLVLVDKTNPFGNQRLLPRGILREPVSHLKRASYVFLTKSDGSSSDELEEMVHRHHPEVEIIECEHKPTHLQSLDLKEKLPADHLKGARIAAFSGIAVPEGFEGFLRDHGASIRYNRRFLDHHWFSDRDLENIAKRAKEMEVDYIVTTEKDAVRISKDYDFGLPTYFLRLEIGLLSGANDFEEAVARVCFPGRPLAEKAQVKDALRVASAS